MSDTPRTESWCGWGVGGLEVVPASFGRELERELSKAVKERDEARKQLEYANGKLSEAVDKLQELRGIILGSGGMEGEQ